MSLAYLMLGSNSGNKDFEINKATKYIGERIGEIIRSSSLYETAPWGFQSEDYFLNQVICVNTLLEPPAILENIIAIEAGAGRIRKKQGYESRIIDIDILFYSNEVINTKTIKIPHPLLHLRKFTLEPLREIAADFIHPILNKSIQEIYNECNDVLIVRKII